MYASSYSRGGQENDGKRADWKPESHVGVIDIDYSLVGR
jgi:hypothetical protein